MVKIAFQICEFKFCVEIMYKRSRETGARGHGNGDTKRRFWRPSPRAASDKGKRYRPRGVKRVHEATGMKCRFRRPRPRAGGVRMDLRINVQNSEAETWGGKRKKGFPYNSEKGG